MATAATIDVLLRANTASYRAAMVDASRVTNRHLGQIQREAEKTAKVMGQMRTALAGVFTAQVARSGITALLDTAKAQQALVNSMQASVGSARGSAEAMAFVAQTSKELGLNFESAARGFQRLTASATAVGVPMRDQQKLFLELSRAATSLQLAPEVVDRAMTALSQSFSKGRFQAEELRQQLAEAIPGVVPRFQKAVLEMTKGTDLAGKSFDQLLQGGLLDVERFLPAMIQSFADLGKNWKDSAQSMQAESNRLGNAWRKMKLELADGAFSDTAVAGMKAATVALEGMGSILPVVVPPMVALAGIKLGKSTADWVKGLTASQKALEAQALVARAAAAEQVKRTALEAQFAIIEAEKARRTGGLILLEREVTIATAAHTAAVRNLDAAEKQVAATQSLTRRAGAAALGIFGGPVGLAATIGLTAASWLYFRSSTKEAQQALIEWNGTADQAITKFYEMNKAQQAGAILQLEQQIEERRRQLSETLRNMATAAGPSENIISEQDYRLAVQYADGMRQLEAQWAAGKLSADELSNQVDALNKRVISGSESSRHFSTYLTEQGAALGTTSREAQALQGQLDTVTGKQHAARDAALAHANGLRTLNSAANSMNWGNLDEWLKKQQEAAGGRYSQAALGEIGALREQFEQQLLKDQAYMKGTRAEVEARRSQWEAIERTLEATKKLEEAKSAEAKASRAAMSASEDAAQSALRNAQARQQEYQLELAAGDSLSASKRELLKFELLLRDTKDKSLKAGADEIRAVLQANVALEDQIDATRRLHEAKLRALAVDRQIADYQQSMAQRHARDLDAIRFGGNTARWNEIANSVSDHFQQQRLGIDRELQDRLATIPIEQMARRNEEEARYQQLLGKTVIAEAEAMAKSRKNFEELLEAQSNWINGFQRARDTYIAQAQDIASQTESIFSSAFQGLEDVFTDFFTKGSADWKGFLDGINRQILQFIIRQQMSKWIESLFGGGWEQASGIGSPIQVGNSILGGGGNGGNWFTKFLGGLFGGFERGGYTGPGHRLQPAGVVHKGEVVWSQPDVARAGGVAVVEAMRRGLRGYADGGWASGSAAVAVGRRPEDSDQPGAAGGSRARFQQQVHFHVEGKIDRRSQSKISAEMYRQGLKNASRLG